MCARLLGTVLVAVAAASACKPELVVGTRTCFADADANTSDEDSGGASDEAVSVPWHTSFERGFCDYRDVGGYCKVNSQAAHDIVASPVHGGQFAASFEVTGNASEDALQARCVVQGSLPTTAYYGAWYWFPSYADNMMDWNLFHFEGWNPTEHHRLWDVSVQTSNSGELSLFFYDFLSPQAYPPTTDVPLPIGSWVHIELYLARAADASGSVALYQDGQLLRELSGIVTDDTERAKWYVGNFADSLTPPDYTLYVDDVTIGASL